MLAGSLSRDGCAIAGMLYTWAAWVGNGFGMSDGGMVDLGGVWEYGGCESGNVGIDTPVAGMRFEDGSLA